MLIKFPVTYKTFGLLMFYCYQHLTAEINCMYLRQKCGLFFFVIYFICHMFSGNTMVPLLLLMLLQETLADKGKTDVLIYLFEASCDIHFC